MNATAQDILESDAFKGAIERLKARNFDAYQRADPADGDALRAIALENQALDNLIETLRRELTSVSPNLRKTT